MSSKYTKKLHPSKRDIFLVIKYKSSAKKQKVAFNLNIFGFSFLLSSFYTLIFGINYLLFLYSNK